jgi:BirA family biotin operon repressor/biotin-[acetyl-CoA-carboxylase] ligase
MSRFDLDRLRGLLQPGEIDWSLHYEAECDSTQDLARAAAGRGVDQGWTLITDLQRQGRGRQGRAWITPAGEALLLSMVLRPPIDVLAKLPLLAGLAVAGGVELVTGVATDLKWPNDVLLAERKLAGILLERPAGSAVVVGMGINVNQSAVELPERAISLAMALGRPVDREPLLAAILNDLANAYERADREGVQWIVPAWRSRSSMLGRPLRFVWEGAPREGVALDITEEGALRVRTTDGRELDLLAGEVESVRPA